ncbi:hypothetical protein LG943_05550 [Streptomonospora sp. S1-112]|uniref:Galactose-1-phosphate uridylyltransferase n=1 Tax=Streptomonospora mangrovi TaxID=2883123 RepID=A0A9X3NHF0_9ACTN|nr:hypothetical protein [Streptomonospora mangrovi]MDA0563794.1 hypothetical protein [Streptomonospora mangrovi]
MTPLTAPEPAWVRDPWSRRGGYIAAHRNHRPADGPDCPFCPSGREAPPAYAAPYAFPNRWPPLPAGRSTVVVHDRDHDGDFGTIPAASTAAVVDLWAATTRAHAALPGVGCVLVFENRGAAAGATVAHPHSQVFALPPLDPPPPGADCPGCAPPDPALAVTGHGRWHILVPEGPTAPYMLRLAPRRHVGALPDLDAAERRDLAAALRDAVRRLDGLFGTAMPYHLSIRQDLDRPAHLYADIAGLLRAPGRLRVLGAAETATGLFFTPVDPRDAAARLRAAAGAGVRQAPGAGAGATR